MTREETIRMFRKEIECLSHTKCEDCILEKVCDPMQTPADDKYIEAYAMAIKALEQEPCEDCISRQTVLDMMQMKMGGKELYKAVYDLPSVNPKEPKAGWIPVSERLPEKEGTFLVSFANGDVVLSSWSKEMPYNNGFDRISYCASDIGPVPYMVKAWRELPEPYKEE